MWNDEDLVGIRLSYFDNNIWFSLFYLFFSDVICMSDDCYCMTTWNFKLHADRNVFQTLSIIYSNYIYTYDAYINIYVFPFSEISFKT